MTLTRLNHLITQIDSWPDNGTNYPAGSWASLVAVAKEVQECDQSSVEKTFVDYYNSSYADKWMISAGRTNSSFAESVRRIEADGKLLLMMRVLFDLPESATNDMRPKFFAWAMVGSPQGGFLNSDGTFNIAWPIRWNNGSPQLVTAQTGIQGPVNVYDLPGEYTYFKNHYKFRNLKN